MYKSKKQLTINRIKIDKIDKKIFKLLKDRFLLAEKISLIKKELNLPFHQQSRWMKMVKSRTQLAKNLNIDKKFTIKLLNLIHNESKRIQRAKRKARKQ